MTALIDRLEGVKETGPSRWIARCPSHEDRSPSLSVRLADGDTWLVHCFAGCASTDVITALGLKFSDLFPDRPDHYKAPVRSRIPASDVLAALDHEIQTAAIIITDVLEVRSVDEPTWRRLAQAVARIGSARAACCPARIPTSQRAQA